MGEKKPRDYDREFTKRVGRRSRRRLGLDIVRGIVTRFVVQLEYGRNIVEDEWDEVVRYDHDSEGSSEAAHDVTEDGLHIDIYCDVGKIESHELTPPLPSNVALNRAEGHLRENLEGYIRRFEEWHQIDESR